MKAAAAIITIARAGTAPLHQVLGSDSYALATAQVQNLVTDLEAGHALATTTDITEESR
ncbi:hypothetical protein [Micromonospora sp. NPDC047527]|uniref:hypothetical protein n=1 Tax=Micromonospora sp. NPDC047527 TaxID=3155144 RepID=UPI0034017CC5